MSASNGVVLLNENFSRGLDPERWSVFSGEGFAADGGVVRSTASGITVAPSTRDAENGAPVFEKTLPGFVCHLQWLVTAGEAFAATGGELRIHFRAGARGFGLDRHPYGEAVDDPATDFRLGAGTLNVLDLASGMVFDFWISHGAIHMFYERLRPPGLGLEHEAFTGWTGPVLRSPDTIHDFCIAIDADGGTVRWELDGETVATVDEIGPSRPGWVSVLDHGGTPETVRLNQLQVGLGLMTLPDASFPPGNHGLVDLGAESDYIGARPGRPKTFQGGPRLFGQGVELTVEQIVVERDSGSRSEVERGDRSVELER